MGKKSGKRKFDAFAEKSGASDPPPPPDPQVDIKYEDMPDNHKKKFYIYEDCNCLYKYIELIQWLRVMGCYCGTTFDGIQNLNFDDVGYPLVEVEVVTPEEKSAKFLIKKQDLYVIAFLAGLRWFQYENCGFRFQGFKILEKFTGSYKGTPWDHLGPKGMIDAINRLASLDVETHNGDMSEYVESCEVFYIHLSEAARLYPVESLICRTLVPRNDDGEPFEKVTFEDEERRLLDGSQTNVSERNDVLQWVRAEAPIEFSFETTMVPNVQRLLNGHAYLSRIWYLYSLSQRRLFDFDPKKVTHYRMRSIKSLRCTLAVLSCSNLDKLLYKWQKKIGSGISRELYGEMTAKVRNLKEAKKVNWKFQDDNA